VWRPTFLLTNISSAKVDDISGYLKRLKDNLNYIERQNNDRFQENLASSYGWQRQLVELEILAKKKEQ